MPPQNQQQPLYPDRPSAPYGPGMPQITPPKKSRPIGLIISFVLAVLMFLGAAGFGVWAYGQRNDYRDNVAQKVTAGVEALRSDIDAEKTKEFLEKEKNPYRQYSGPAQYGGIEIMYPKTWSAYVSEADKGSTPVDGYFHPDFVPDTGSGAGFALRLEVIEKPYDKVLVSYESSAKKGLVQISPYSPAKVPTVLGVRINGEIVKGHQGSLVLLPLRDKTIRISTLSPEFVGDFDNIILPNLVFTP